MTKYSILSLIFIINIVVQAQTPEWIIYNEFNSGLPGNQVHTIEVDDENIKWIGTADGLARFDGTNWIVFNTTNSNIPSNEIYALEIVDDETWVGTSNGLAKYDGSDWTIFDNSQSIFTSSIIVEIEKDKQNNYWVASELNVVQFNKSSWQVLKTFDAIGAIHSLAVDSTGQIWAGDFDYDTHNGVLWKFDGTNVNYYPMRHYPELISSFPNAISFDANNILWMVFSGTVGGGLVKIENENWTIFKNTNSGFPNGGGSSLVIQNNIKWIGTSAGLVSFDVDNWNVFNKSNTLLPDDWVYTITLDKFGNKWLGTITGGVAIFNQGGISNTNDDAENVPIDFQLYQNYPNPFNPSTKIKYSIASDAYNAFPVLVQLKVFDILGNEIATLVNESQSAGIYDVELSTDGSSGMTSNNKLPSGVYFYSLQVNNFTETKKMILLR